MRRVGRLLSLVGAAISDAQALGSVAPSSALLEGKRGLSSGNLRLLLICCRVSVVTNILVQACLPSPRRSLMEPLTSCSNSNNGTQACAAGCQVCGGSMLCTAAADGN